METLTQLLQLGLSENEAKVYLAALELGPTTAMHVSQKAEINRPTAYVQIDNLMEMGLMSSYTTGKKRYFTVEHPERLRDMLKIKEKEVAEQKKYLKEILPELQALFLTTKERPKVRFYEGKEGILAMTHDAFKAKQKTILAVIPYDLNDKLFNEQERKEFESKRKRRKIKARTLYTRKEGPFTTPPPATIEDRYIPQNLFPITASVDIYDNKIAAYTLRGKLIGVIIESKEIADTLRAIFSLAWEGAEKYQ